MAATQRGYKADMATILVVRLQPYSFQKGEIVKVHTEELVYTDSDDGVLLTGMLMRLTSVSEKPIAVVYIHGRAG